MPGGGSAPRQIPEPPGEGPVYHRLLVLGGRGVWRPLVGLLLLVALVLVGQVAVTTGAAFVLALSGASLDEVGDQLTGDTVTPAFLAVVNLGWAVAIPAVWLVLFAVHRLRPGWASSVVGRLRWRWLLTCLAIALATLAVTVVVSSFLPAQGDGSVEVSGRLNPWSTTVRDFLLVIVLLTPLQAAGEEYAFRGYLAQALGRLGERLGDRVATAVAIVVPALLFALAHGAGQDIPIFFDRFAFGIVAGVLVLLTGGLEAGIAMHVLNNFLAFGLALAFGDMTAALTPTDGSWWNVPATLTQSLIYLGACLWAARALGLAHHATVPGGRGVLEPPTGRV